LIASEPTPLILQSSSPIFVPAVNADATNELRLGNYPFLTPWVEIKMSRATWAHERSFYFRRRREGGSSVDGTLSG
jgi:hypothetical protein